MTREREKGKTGDDQRQSRKREDERERSGSVRKILEVLVRYRWTDLFSCFGSYRQILTYASHRRPLRPVRLDKETEISRLCGHVL
jgi:hypothetical protein